MPLPSRRAGARRSAATHPGDKTLIRLIDAEIDHHSQAAVEAHLSKCEKCRAQLDQLRSAMGYFVEFEEMLLRTQSGIGSRRSEAQQASAEP